MEQEKESVKCSTGPPDLDVWIEIMSLFLNLDKYGKGEQYLLGTDGNFRFTGKSVIGQCGHNDFQLEAYKAPGYFIIGTGSDGCSTYVCPGSKLCVRFQK